MQYLLMIYSDPNAETKMTADELGKRGAAYQAYTEALQSAGVFKAGDRLHQASAATTVRMVDGKTRVLDGPYAETKEQLGGYYIVEVPDLDAALSWAARCPNASDGVMEVRPIY